MNPIHAAVLGLVQGLTEFLPVSSSAHLYLVPWFFHWAESSLAFDVALHWGTLLAACIYFRKDLLQLFGGFLGSLSGGREFENRLPWYLILATIPGAVVGKLIQEQAETVFRSPWIVAFNLAFVGILLGVIDKVGKKRIPLEQIALRQALLIGVAQCLALVPGVSRSGITICAGLLMGLDREAAVRFSFLLAIPITAGAGLVKVGFLIHNIHLPELWLGIATSALSGFLAIHILITYVKTRTFTPFVIYRILLAAVVAYTALQV